MIYSRGTARISQSFRCLRDGHAPKGEHSRGSRQPAGCSFCAFNSEISERGSELHIRGAESFAGQRR